VILARRKLLRLALSLELSESPPEKKVQYREESENENNSIHSGGLFVRPQSYGTASPLSRTPQPVLVEKPTDFHSNHSLKRPSLTSAKGPICPEDPVLQMDMLPFHRMLKCLYDDLR